MFCIQQTFGCFFELSLQDTTCNEIFLNELFFRLSPTTEKISSLSSSAYYLSVATARFEAPDRRRWPTCFCSIMRKVIEKKILFFFSLSFLFLMEKYFLWLNPSLAEQPIHTFHWNKGKKLKRTAANICEDVTIVWQLKGLSKLIWKNLRKAKKLPNVWRKGPRLRFGDLTLWWHDYWSKCQIVPLHRKRVIRS